jgi:cell division protein FtsW
MTRTAARGGGLRLDPLLIGIVMSILLLGLIMVASASISIASHDGGDPFSYVKSQFLLALAGMGVAAVLCAIPTDLYQKYSTLLLIGAAVLLLAVLIPGVGQPAGIRGGAHPGAVLDGSLRRAPREGTA